MLLSREEKEKMVLDLYYNKGYTYKQLTRELRMSPNQIREIIKRHEEKNDAIANKKKELSLSSKAYKLFYEGKNNVEVAVMLDLPQEQVTKFRLEYWRLRNQDKLESLYMVTKNKVSVLWKIYKELIIIGGMSIEEVASVISTGAMYYLSRLYKELVIKRGMSIEEVASAVDINLNRLPEMERELDQTCKALAKKQVELDVLKEEENRIRNRIVTLPPSSYHYVDNPATNAFPYYSASRHSPSLPYWPSGYPDLTNDYGDALKNSKEKKKIHGMYDGDIAD
jgi:transposase-like protein